MQAGIKIQIFWQVNLQRSRAVPVGPADSASLSTVYAQNGDKLA